MTERQRQELAQLREADRDVVERRRRGEITLREAERLRNQALAKESAWWMALTWPKEVKR